MRIAITGGTGFVGTHLARRLAGLGHEVIRVSRGMRSGLEIPNTTFFESDLGSAEVLEQAFRGCDAVAHCAGINREIGRQTFQSVHVDGTRNVAEAARAAGVQRIALMSFLRARPGCGSPYHESKWAAEEIIRNCGLPFTIVKAGMVYGRGDHMLDHLSHSLHTIPFLPTVGFARKAVRPLAIDDLVNVLTAALANGRLTSQTVALVGAEELSLSEAIRRVARVVHRRVWIAPAPVWLHHQLARVFEWTMKVPLVARAQVRILSEGVTDPPFPCDPVPDDLKPTRRFTDDRIREGLPAPGAFGLRDLRCCLDFE